MLLNNNFQIINSLKIVLGIFIYNDYKMISTIHNYITILFKLVMAAKYQYLADMYYFFLYEIRENRIHSKIIIFDLTNHSLLFLSTRPKYSKIRLTHSISRHIT